MFFFIFQFQTQLKELTFPILLSNLASNFSFPTLPLFFYSITDFSFPSQTQTLISLYNQTLIDPSPYLLHNLSLDLVEHVRGLPSQSLISLLTWLLPYFPISSRTWLLTW
ncbi:hypothetical protein Sjap_010268 [Stephania japonica]|uniref:Uncharacterized protein n=1 Tax=Stephania japonica TaxID=461633 RepID=A0AAP0JB37_9MAGN